MAFWSDKTLDPKRQFKFKVAFDFGNNTAAPFYIAQSADRPSYTVGDTAKVEFLDKTFYYPGKVTWNEVKIKFVDGTDADTNMAYKVYNYLTTTGWVSPVATGRGNLSTVGKNLAAKTDVLIQTLNAKGDIIDQYRLNNAFIKAIEQTNLDYAQDTIATVTLTLRYDWAGYEGQGLVV
jgi:hypothetical protein